MEEEKKVKGMKVGGRGEGQMYAGTGEEGSCQQNVSSRGRGVKLLVAT